MKSLKSLDYELEVAPERIVRGNIELPPPGAWPAPVVLFCHGFKGFKDWGAWPWFARELAARGFVVNRFNFSLSGVGEALDRHDEPHKFARNTYGFELEDLGHLWRHRDHWGLPDGATAGGLALVGHSRGGLVSLLFAAENPDVDAVVTLASPGRADRFPPEVVERWREEGSLEVVNERTGEVLRLDRSVLEDYERHRDRYDVLRAVARREVPTRVIHGAADESVPAVEAEWIDGAFRHPRHDLVIVPGADHTFGTSHGDPEPTPALREVLEHTAAWLEETLDR